MISTSSILLWRCLWYHAIKTGFGTGSAQIYVIHRHHHHHHHHHQENEVTCCYAFMLPVSCPPNAIVYKASGHPYTYMTHTRTRTSWPWCPKTWVDVLTPRFVQAKMSQWPPLKGAHQSVAGMKSWQMLTAGLGLNLATLAVHSPSSTLITFQPL